MEVFRGALDGTVLNKEIADWLRMNGLVENLDLTELISQEMTDPKPLAQKFWSTLVGPSLFSAVCVFPLFVQVSSPLILGLAPSGG